MKLTSAGANKMIKAWNEDLEGLLKKEEAESRTTYGINEEPLPANYDFARMQQQMDALNQKIAVLRHAVNVFNTTTVLEGFGFTIDEALVRMAQPLSMPFMTAADALLVVLRHNASPLLFDLI